MGKQIISIGDTGSQLVAKFNQNANELYSSAASGRYIIEASDVISASNWWTAGLIYVIKSNYDFGGATVVLPENVRLEFDGGIWSNGTIQGADSIFVVNGLIQAFATTLTLTGTWKVDEIEVQYYGATSNVNSTTYSNSSTAAIQKCIDSLFNVRIPAGYYYLASGLNIPKPKTIQLDGGKLPSGSYALDSTIIYTDQDIDIVTIKASYVYWLGGGFDTSHISAHTKSSFRYDCSFNIMGGEIDFHILGNSTSLLASTNTSTAVLFDTVNATANAETHFVKVNGTAYYTKYGIWIQGVNANHSVYISSIINGDLFFANVKQPFRYEQGHFSKITGITQDGYILAEAEKDTAIVYNAATSVVIDVQFYDYDETNSDVNSAPYRHRYTIENIGSYTQLVGASSRNRLIYNSIKEQGNIISNALITGARGLEYPVDKNKFQKASFISRLENILAYADKRYTTSIKKYDGSAKNFDTDLVATTGAETANVTLWNKENMFGGYGYAPRITFTNEATKATDYIEIVITGSLHYMRLLVALNLVYASINRVQLILIKEGETTQVYNEYPIKTETITMLQFGGVIGKFADTTIIRLIGCSLINQVVYIDDIIGIDATLVNSPLIDVGGGQQIFGELTMTKSKYTATPIYADNTAALAGGLTAGMTYRTSTGIRMEVF